MDILPKVKTAIENGLLEGVPQVNLLGDPNVPVGELDVSSRRGLALSTVRKLLGLVGNEPPPNPYDPVNFFKASAKMRSATISTPKQLEPPSQITQKAGPSLGTDKLKMPEIKPPAPLKAPSVKQPSASSTGGPAAPAAGTYDVSSKAAELHRKSAYAKMPVISAKSPKERDLELWRAYNKNPSSQTLKPLMKSLEPVMRSEVSRWAGAVPRSVLEIEAKRLTLQAIKTYDPNAGTAVATHVVNRLRKLSRKTYTHQDIVRLPENKKLKSQTYYKGVEHLKGETGREPTNEEIADHLGWSRKMVTQVQRETVGEYVESIDVGGEAFADVSGRESNDMMLDMVYHDLTPQDQLILEHTTGYTGKPVLTVKELQKKTGLTANQVNYRKRNIAQKIRQYQNI